MKLDEIHVSIPTDWVDEDAWRTALDEAEPVERPLLELQVELGRILKALEPGAPVSTLAPWLILWTRTFQGLEGLRGAIARRSLFTARVLERINFETSIHLMTIAEPISKSKVKMSPVLRQKAVQGRLESYFTWCTWKDLTEWNHFLRPRDLQEIFDPRPGREYARQLGPWLEALSPFLGEWETQTDAEAEQDRSRAEEFAKRRVALLQGWLEDERLKGYYRDLRQRRPESFFEFIHEDQNRMSRVLRGQGMRIGYGIWARGSAIIHGSTLEKGLYFRPPVVGPEIWANDEDLMQTIELGLRWARSSTLALVLVSRNALKS